MVVRGHECVMAKIGGVPYRVNFLLPQIHGGWFCPVCGRENIAPSELTAANLSGLHTSNDAGIPLGWLKRIPPPAELDDVKHDEEITA